MQLAKLCIITFLSLFSLHSIHAQGLGPRTNLLGPIGISGVAFQYVNLSQNLSPSTIFITQAAFEINMFAVSAFHTFKLKNRLAQIVGAVIPATSSLELIEVGTSEPTNFSTNGFTDGYLGLKVGMIGTPALTVTEFSAHLPELSVFSYLRIWFPGSYTNDEVLNLGSNRFTIQYIMPIAIPLNKNKKRGSWLEIFPNVRFFTPNNNPLRTSGKRQIQQKPLFTIENHLSHNFSRKFWMATNLEYQFGGRTIEDGVAVENRINMLSASVSAGYKLHPSLNISADYGKRIFGDNGINSRMLRMTLVFAYAKS